MICKKCGNEFFEKYSKESNGNFCSKLCARRFSSIKTDEIKRKISISAKNSEKVLAENRSRNYGKKIIKKCPICKKEFECWVSENKKIYCSKECYNNDKYCKYRKGGMGGFRIGSGRCNGGYYKNIYCHSTYELAFLIWNLDNSYNIKRCNKIFEYEYKGKRLKYFPDFEIDNVIYEIKGYWQEKVDFKTQSVIDQGYVIKVLYLRDIKYMIDYVKEKYNILRLESLYAPIIAKW